MKSLSMKRRRETFIRNPNRVLAKFHFPPSEKRVKNIINRILSLSEEETHRLLESVIKKYEDRHNDLEKILLTHFERIQTYLPKKENLSYEQMLLLGSFFTREYSIEAAALFNPSIILHPDQNELSTGETRFILSLRATGEGHISSIVFRGGIIDKKNRIKLDPVSPYVELPHIEFDPIYEKDLFLTRLAQLNVDTILCDQIFEELPDRFRNDELQARIQQFKTYQLPSQILNATLEIIGWIANSNYTLNFRPESDLSERVIFPVSKMKSRGIEDARFVRFVDNNDSITYYATYTSYTGYTNIPMLLETQDFINFKMCTLNGHAARGKGMSLFPKKINDQYIMISRQDGENLFIMKSKNIHFWHEVEKLQVPKYDWEFIQIGNCGSPIETKEGWLLLTHGVGPLREYCIGSMLLDIDDPAKVIGSLKEPLLEPNVMEREGYVPNVVYTCGAMIHDETLILPYASSDTFSGIATIDLEVLTEELLNS
ncbi:MAG: glycoside hydrolase family 130 protein [Candidatus Hodarchaeales archaeon]|jgi:predicted GH43/DUF377 family glycosyl hydrolase